jgi:transposase
MNNKPVDKPDWKEMRRFRALDLHDEGWTQMEIAEALGVTKMAVSKWLKVVREQGAQALQARPHLGAVAKLTRLELEAIPELLAIDAESYGFRGKVWTCERVAQVIKWAFGVSYHQAHVSRLLKDLDWTPQKPRTPATQRAAKEITRWRREVWPRLKKRPAASGATWSV